MLFARPGTLGRVIHEAWKMHMRWTLFVLLTITQGALAQDRLLIEVVPVRIMPVDTTDYQMISIVYDYEVLIAAHEAIASLGLRLGFLTPEIVLADGGFEILECTYAEPGIRSTCTPPEWARAVVT